MGVIDTEDQFTESRKKAKMWDGWHGACAWAYNSNFIMKVVIALLVVKQLGFATRAAIWLLLFGNQPAAESCCGVIVKNLSLGTFTNSDGKNVWSSLC